MPRSWYIWTVIIAVLAGCASSEANTPDSGPRVGLELVADGLTAPIALVSPGDGTGRLLVADQRGTIWVLTAKGRMEEPFLDLSDRMVGLNIAYDERGLLGLAFHPAYAENGRFFVYYSAPLREGAPAGWNHTSHLAEYRVSETDPNRADPDSERILLQVDQPQANHDGGQIVFGPDGYLYVPLGDGGGANDTGRGHPPSGNGQDCSTLLGSILRLDVDGAEPYGIPSDNPFADGGGRPEIYAYGLRNPFRISFDAEGEDQLYAGDAGQNLWEEIDLITKGANYGWNLREGTHCFDPQRPSDSPASCPDTGANGEPLVGPIIEYDHQVGIAVIGGYVYRGSLLPQFSGRYIFGDWSTGFVVANGKLFVATPSESGQRLWQVEKLEIATSQDGEVGAYVLSVGQDADGELYVLTSRRSGPVGTTGRVYRLVPAPG